VSFFELLVLAIGLAMDATAVAGARGLAAKKVRVGDAALVAVFFGGAQALMPAIGWVGGAAVSTRVMGWGRWITFGVLATIGAKMIYEALSSWSDEGERVEDPFGVKVLAALAVATSIDALAAGVTLAVRDANVAISCTVIGLVTAAASFAGVYTGRRFGARLGKRLDVFGGLVLIGLAVKAIVDRHG
jgi:putative Mn2+ efflux pump MntP